MSRWNEFWSRVGGTLRRRRLDTEMEEEIRLHVEERMARNRAAGMDADEARAAAWRTFGRVDGIKERARDIRRLRWAEEFAQDVRFAVRQLLKTPAFSVTAIISLAVGIGANLVGLGLLNAVWLQPLAIREPGTLFQLRDGARTSGGMLTTSYPAFGDISARTATFSAMAASYGYSRLALGWRSDVIRVRGVAVSGNYFDVLGVEPQVGRLFHPADEKGANSAPYVVLSDALWRRTFNADPEVVGQTVRLNKHPFTVVGVAAAAFHGTERFEWPDYWYPLVNAEQVEGGIFLGSRTRSAVTVLGRLKPGVTPAQATQELNALTSELAREHPATDRAASLRLIQPGLFADDADAIRKFLFGAAGLAGLLLLAACANLAGLFAARATDRRRELALRLALGSTRLRLVRQILTEALVIAVAGAVAGLVVACGLVGALNRWQPPFEYGGQRLALSVTLDGWIYFAGIILAVGSALLVGLVPARQAWSSSPLPAIKGGEDTPRLRRFAVRDGLLGLQIATCTVLVIAALVAMHGLRAALGGSLGIQPAGATLVTVDLGEVGGMRWEKTRALLEAAAAMPGVAAVGAASGTLGAGSASRGVLVFRPETAKRVPAESALTTRQYSLTPGYLGAAGTRLVRGRDISWQDVPGSPLVALVNETFARKMWGDGSAVGQRFFMSGDLREVVGVVEDGKYHDLMESAQPAAFLPLAQAERREIVLVVRSLRAPHETAAGLQRVIRPPSPDAPLTIQSWPEALGSVLFPVRAATLALGTMGAMAALLAITGIFGMAAYSVTRRRRELGIRVALGAPRSQVIIASIGRPAWLLAIGSATGLIGAFAVNRLLGHLVYQADLGSPMVLVGVLLAMTTIGFAGMIIPVRRALAIDPVTLMKAE